MSIYQWGGGIGASRIGVRVKRYKLLCTKQRSYKDILYSTENIVNIFCKFK